MTYYQNRTYYQTRKQAGADPRACARRGAQVLDDVAPGWAEFGITRKIRVESTTDCPLGQLFGSFDRGYQMIGLGWPLDGGEVLIVDSPILKAARHQHHAAIWLGFNAMRDYRAIWAINRAWRREVRARRHAQAPPLVARVRAAVRAVV